MYFFLNWWYVATWCLFFLLYSTSHYRQKVVGCGDVEDNQHPLKSIWWRCMTSSHKNICIYLFYSLGMQALLRSTIFFNSRPSSFYMRWTDTTSAYHFLFLTSGRLFCLHASFSSCLLDVNDHHNRNDDLFHLHRFVE
jgi:hypothetical protein